MFLFSFFFSTYFNLEIYIAMSSSSSSFLCNYNLLLIPSFLFLLSRLSLSPHHSICISILFKFFISIISLHIIFMFSSTFEHRTYICDSYFNMLVCYAIIFVNSRSFSIDYIFSCLWVTFSYIFACGNFLLNPRHGTFYVLGYKLLLFSFKYCWTDL